MTNMFNTVAAVAAQAVGTLQKQTPFPALTFRGMIDAVRQAGKPTTQMEITAQAVAAKRFLEARGLFPGLQRGTTPKPAQNKLTHEHPVTGEVLTFTRGDRKRAARARVTQENTSSAAIPWHHQHSGRRYLPVVLTTTLPHDQRQRDKVRALAAGYSTGAAKLLDYAKAGPLVNVPHVEELPGHLFAVVNDGVLVGGPYKERKTANRRVKQLVGAS